MLLTFGLSYYADKVSLQVMSLIMGQYDTEVVVCSLFKSEVKLLKKKKTGAQNGTLHEQKNPKQQQQNISSALKVVQMYKRR